MFREVLSYSRMALAFGRHLRTPADPEPAGSVRHHLENRNPNFLSLVRDVLARPEHPYAQLFQIAGCTYADLEASVHREGLEPTLAALQREGVYVTHDEFRGREEIVRCGRHIRSSAASWLNERGIGHAVVQTSSGSSGSPLKTNIGNAYLRHQESCVQLMVRKLDLANRVTVSAGPILPGYGIFSAILASRNGVAFERWYAPGGMTRGNLHYRVATLCITAQLRFFGAGIPYPIYLAPNDYRPVAEYLAQRHSEGTLTALAGLVSSITRIAAEAVDRGMDLTGCRAVLAGEALTDAKRAVIESAGIEPYPTYGATDAGLIGFPCSAMHTGNCVHVFRHGIALTTRPTGLDGGGESLCVTSLLPFAPRVLINVEIGDTGVIEKSTCNCSYARLGLDLQVRNMAAISKVTAQGMTIAATDLVRLLEEAMPARFGGRPGDYQLAEIEGQFQTETVLRIRPGVAAAEPQAMLDFFLAETRRLYGGSLSVASWTHSGGIRVALTPPELAVTGKFRAVRLLGPGITRAAGPSSSLS